MTGNADETPWLLCRRSYISKPTVPVRYLYDPPPQSPPCWETGRSGNQWRHHVSQLTEATETLDLVRRGGEGGWWKGVIRWGGGGLRAKLLTHGRHRDLCLLQHPHTNHFPLTFRGGFAFISLSPSRARMVYYFKVSQQLLEWNAGAELMSHKSDGNVATVTCLAVAYTSYKYTNAPKETRIHSYCGK